MEQKTPKEVINAISIAVMVVIFLVIAAIIVSSFLNTSTTNCTPAASSSSSQSILAASTATLTPINFGITSNTATILNKTWLNFDGIDDFIFIPDNSDLTISYWFNDTSNNWIHVVNASGILYEDGGIVGSLTLEVYKKNGTGWYMGENSTGFFKGNIDEIRFFNETLNVTQVNEVFDNGR